MLKMESSPWTRVASFLQCSGHPAHNPDPKCAALPASNVESILKGVLRRQLTRMQQRRARHAHHAGIAAKVLKSLGVSLKDARVEVEKIIGRGSGFVAVEIPFTPRAKRVLEMSLEEARQLGEDGGRGRGG